MLCIIKRTFLLIIVLGGVYCCQVRPISSAQKSERVKARIEKKQKAEREKQRNIAIKEHYDRQAESTRESMKQNQNESENWLNDNFHNKSVFYYIKRFFKNLKPEPKPEKGLFSRKQSRNKRSNFFNRIFKKKK